MPAYYLTMDPEQAIELLKPFFESSIVIAGEYCNACGRNTLTPQDVEYGSRFAARYIAGIEEKSFFPDTYQSDDDDYEDDYEEEGDCDEPEDPFVRYTGDDARMNAINACYDTWDQWEPELPLQRAAKNAVGKK